MNQTRIFGLFHDRQRLFFFYRLSPEKCIKIVLDRHDSDAYLIRISMPSLVAGYPVGIASSISLSRQ
jgi:hypothetical protein